MDEQVCGGGGCKAGFVDGSGVWCSFTPTNTQCSNHSLPHPHLHPQHKDLYGGYGGGRLLRIAADKMQRAAAARRKDRQAAMDKVAGGIGAHGWQVGPWRSPGAALPACRSRLERRQSPRCGAPCKDFAP